MLTRRSFVASTLLAPALARAADVPWLESVTRPAVKTAGKPVPSLLVDAGGKPITTVEQWEKRRVEIRQWWLDFMHPITVPRPAISVQVISEDRDAGVLRQLVKYENEPGEFLEAYVLKPLKITGKLPGVVVLHSTSDDTIRQGAGLGSQPLKGFGLMMAQRGCVAICPKNFLWTGPRNDKGKYDFKATTAAVLRKYAPSLGMAKMLFDAQRAVDALVSLPNVDAARLGCIGHSLGGKEALYLPAFDDRIKTAVSSEGGVPMNSTNWHDPWYLGPAVKDPAFGHDHHELVALIAPRPWLLVGGESADGDKSWPYLEAARPVYELYGKPARLGMYNHRRGHVVDEEIAVKMCDWLSAYL